MPKQYQHDTDIFTAEQKAELDRRYKNHQENIGRTYTWDQTVAMAEQALAARRERRQSITHTPSQ